MDTRPPHPLHAAIGLFTVVPVPPMPVDRATAQRAILALPWVGLLVGLAAAAASVIVDAVGGGRLLAAIAALGVLAAVTGAMHLDGLADTADGLGSRKPGPEALTIMRASDIGPMGVAALVLVLLADAAALTSPRLGQHPGDLALTAVVAALPMVGRVPALVATLAPPARPDGFGALFARVAPRGAIIVDAAAVAAVVFTLGTLARGPFAGGVLVLAAAAAWAVAAAWRRHLTRRLGGTTGDTYGSLIEVAQVAFVVLAALAF